MTMKKYGSHFFLAFLLLACANESDPVADKSNFTRIYDNNKFNASYFPIDLHQTPDGGYLILAARRLENSNFSGIYVMKVDELGGFVKDKEVDETYINPVGQLLEVNGKYYFFCMTVVSFETQLVEMDATGEISQVLNVGGSYPTAATADNSNFILLSYDNLNKQSVVSVVSPAGSISKSKGFSIGAGQAVEEPIISHFIRTGRQFPFQVGKTAAGLYYFNGFYNYTFSLVFTDLTQDDPQGVVQGQQDDGGLSQVVELSGGKFAGSRFNFGDNYFLPNVPISASGVSSSTDLGGNPFPELVPNAPVHILKANIHNKNILIYASNTLGRQIALFNFDQASAAFLGSRYLGFSNPFEVANLISTADGGVAICGTTYAAGRFPRICLFKISGDEFSRSLKF